MLKWALYLAGGVLSLSILLLPPTVKLMPQPENQSYLIAYPLRTPCIYGTCPHDIGILNPDTGQISILNVGSTGLNGRAIQGSAIMGQIVHPSEDKANILNLEGETLFSVEHGLFPFLWSPDGLHIAFRIFGNDSLGGDLYVINTDGVDLTQLTTDLNVQSFTWLPDSNRLAILTFDNTFYEVDIDEDRLKHLSNVESVFPPQIVWSPNGQHVTYGNENGLHILNINDGMSRTINTETGVALAWINNQIIYGSEGKDRHTVELKLFNMEDASSQDLHTTSNAFLHTVSPDGRQILYVFSLRSNNAVEQRAGICIFDVSDQAETCFPEVDMFWDGRAVWVAG